MDSRETQSRVGDGPSGRTHSGQIKTDIDHTRERMDHTLDALGEKLHPKHLLEEALDCVGSPAQIKGTASKLGQTLWHQIEEYPMPSLLIGAGLLWMFREQRNRRHPSLSGSSLHENASSARESARQAGESIKEHGREMAHSLKEKGSEQAGRLKESAGRISAQARERTSSALQTTQEKFARTRDDYPLATGLGFLALGVLAGLALPHTSVEDRTVGQHSDAVKAHAREQGQHLMETAQQTAAAVAGAAAEVSREQGLTTEKIGEKIGHVISETKRAASEAAQQEGLDPSTLKSQVQNVAEQTKQAAKDELSRHQGA